MKTDKLEKYFKKYSYNVNKVVGVDPFDFDNLLLLENGVLSEISKKEIKQEYLIASYIPNRDVITYELTIQKNLLEKIELEDYIETKCYEEVGLDEAEEYIFKHKVVDSIADEKNLIVEVVIISKTNMVEKYQSLKDNYGYLDYLTYPGYVFDVLYKENILEPQNDLYIYFTKDDIFITLYGEGKFLQTSVIPEGLQNIYEELVNSIKIKDFDFNVFMSLLVKKGLDLNNYSEKQHVLFNELSELFSNKFLIISNQIHSIVRKFSLTTIDRIYMSTIKGVIPGISEFANMYLGVEANDLKFDLNYNPNDIEIDQIMFLSMLSAQHAYKKEEQVDNFTIFQRPPTFFYRKSGQLISISIISLLLSISYPIYEVIDTFFINNSNETKQIELNKLKHTNNKLNKLNKNLKSKVEQKESQKDNLIKYIKDRESIIDTIYKEKKGYIPKAVLIAKVSEYLDKNEVYLKEIKYGNIQKESKTTRTKSKKTKTNINSNNKKLLLLTVYSKSDSKITNFINNLVKDEHIIVETPGYKRERNLYTAEVGIKVEK